MKGQLIKSSAHIESHADLLLLGTPPPHSQELQCSYCTSDTSMTSSPKNNNSFLSIVNTGDTNRVLHPFAKNDLSLCSPHTITLTQHLHRSKNYSFDLYTIVLSLNWHVITASKCWSTFVLFQTPLWVWLCLRTSLILHQLHPHEAFDLQHHKALEMHYLQERVCMPQQWPLFVMTSRQQSSVFDPALLLDLLNTSCL